MLISTLLFSVVVPITASKADARKIVAKPYIVQAVIDSAQIAGLPSSKAAKAHAKKIQEPDPLLQQIIYISDPLSTRKLFFKQYFQDYGA